MYNLYINNKRIEENQKKEIEVEKEKKLKVKHSSKPFLVIFQIKFPI